MRPLKDETAAPMIRMIGFCLTVWLASSVHAQAADEDLQPFETDFFAFDPSLWYIADYVNGGGWIDTSWSRENFVHEPGQVTLELNGKDDRGKNFTGGEFKTQRKFHYGTFEVRMKPSGETGALSSFFTYTGPFFDDPVSEIDFEFVGEDTTKVLLTYHTPDGSNGEFVDLGFDAAESFNDYRFDWAPDSITWYANGQLLRRVEQSDIGWPTAAGQIFMSIWTGSSKFTGIADPEVTASAAYQMVRFTPRTAPVAVDDEFNVIGSGVTPVYPLLNDYGYDRELNASSVKIVDQGAGGEVKVDPETGEVTFEAAEGFSGTATFKYTVGDGVEVSNAAQVSINVIAVKQ
ncbi:MAG: family 16 glycosylhydrolase [Pseudomonadota bacterium]